MASSSNGMDFTMEAGQVEVNIIVTACIRAHLSTARHCTNRMVEHDTFSIQLWTSLFIICKIS